MAECTAMSPADAASTFLLGLLGTAHCIGMCGPLVLVVAARSSRPLAHAAYHLGRIATYVSLGAVLGALAPGISGIAGLAGDDPARILAKVQVGLSLFSAVLLLALGVERLGLVRLPSIVDPTRIPGYSRVRAGMVAGHAGAIFLFGALMATLPCGLVWAAFARALGAGSAQAGAVLVFAFGLGTLPGLLLLGTGAARWARKRQRVIDLAAGVLVLAMALRLAVNALGTLMG
jgi:sulfite exporter TauE/SafE